MDDGQEPSGLTIPRRWLLRTNQAIEEQRGNVGESIRRPDSPGRHSRGHVHRAADEARADREARDGGVPRPEARR